MSMTSELIAQEVTACTFLKILNNSDSRTNVLRIQRKKSLLERSGRTSDSESRGPGFDLHWRHHVVSLSKAN